jgi:hypothetical protein
MWRVYISEGDALPCGSRSGESDRCTVPHPSVNNARGRTEKLTISTRSITFLNKALQLGPHGDPRTQEVDVDPVVMLRRLPASPQLTFDKLAYTSSL